MFQKHLKEQLNENINLEEEYPSIKTEIVYHARRIYRKLDIKNCIRRTRNVKMQRNIKEQTFMKQ